MNQVRNEIMMLDEADGFSMSDIIAFDDKDGRLVAREKIEGFVIAMQEVLGSKTGDMEKLNDNGLKEYFVGGAYIRELLIPAGITVVSQLWKKDRFWIITEGDVTFSTELGKKRILAPYFQIAPYGTKVALHAHTDTRWFAITGAKATNSKDIETEVIAKDYTECTYPWDQLEGETQ